jgi:hypothetical protein
VPHIRPVLPDVESPNPRAIRAGSVFSLAQREKSGPSGPRRRPRSTIRASAPHQTVIPRSGATKDLRLFFRRGPPEVSGLPVFRSECRLLLRSPLIRTNPGDKRLRSCDRKGHQQRPDSKPF